MMTRRLSYLLAIVIFSLPLMTIDVLSANEITAEEKKVPHRIHAIVPIVQQWGSNATLIAAVNAQNSAAMTLESIQRTDKQWRTDSGLSDFMQSLMDSPAAQELFRLEKSQSYFIELFLMDNQGANVAMTNKTSDYWQGDEAKFIESFKQGSGAVHVGKVKFDESTQAFLVQISVPVMDKGKAIGAITVGINLNVQPKTKLQLTEQERNWLDAHTAIRFGFTAEFEPMIIAAKNGRISGALIDLIEALNQQLDTQITIEIAPWAETVKKAQLGKIDGLLAASPSARGSEFLFSIPTHQSSAAVFSRIDTDFSITGWQDLSDRRIVVAH